MRGQAPRLLGVLLHPAHLSLRPSCSRVLCCVCACFFFSLPSLRYALALEAAFPELLGALCGVGKPAAAKLVSQQALAKQLGALLDFVIRFDHIKMNTPSIQNDFSYYRRSMTRMKRDAPGGAAEGVLTDEVANRMSLFYASHTPVMTALVGATTSYVHGNRDDGLQLESVCSALSVMAHSCRDMLKNHQFESAATNLFCLRAMVASIILYDQLDAVGAFHRKSPINIRGCVQVLREWPDAGERLSLANMLRFTTRHLRDESTPAGVVELLNDAAAESGPD